MILNVLLQIPDYLLNADDIDNSVPPRPRRVGGPGQESLPDKVGPFQSILNGGPGDLSGLARPNQQRPDMPGLRPLKPQNKFRPGGENESIFQIDHVGWVRVISCSDVVHSPHWSQSRQSLLL